LAIGLRCVTFSYHRAEVIIMPYRALTITVRWQAIRELHGKLHVEARLFSSKSRQCAVFR